MTENNRHLTFSKRNGLAPIPQLLKLGEISKEFRIRILNILHYFIDGEIYIEIQKKSFDSESKDIVIRNIHEKILKEPIYELYSSSFDIKHFYKATILYKEYGTIFDIIEYVMRLYPREDFNFFSEFKKIFEECALAYTIVDEKCPTIVPAATPEEGETIREAFEAAKDDKYAPAREHLRQSAGHINASQPANAIRESIHAVESVLRIVTDIEDFNKALQKLETSHRIHKALKEAFKKLYAYTCDEQGIRHALVDKPESPATMDEAVFMLGACAAFVGYVIRKS